MIRLFPLLLLFGLSEWARASAEDVAAPISGLVGVVMVHETGHALAAKAMGWNIDMFRPWPTRVTFTTKDGRKEDHWVMGMVKSSPDGAPPMEELERKQAIIAAMGTSATALSVLLLSPLLPNVSGFGASALNDYLLFATFDWPAYTFADTLAAATKGTWLHPNSFGDWGQVSATTGIRIGWFFVAALAESLLLNEYRLHFRRQAINRGAISGASTSSVLGFRFSF